MSLTVLVVEAVIVVGFWVVVLKYLGVTLGIVYDLSEKKVGELRRALAPEVDTKGLRARDLCPYCKKERLQIEYLPHSYLSSSDFLPFNLKCSYCNMVIPGER